jgi:uncharacterized protein
VSRPPVVDVHVHLSETKAIGQLAKSGYEIWEYGAKGDVAFGAADGDLDDLRRAMRTGGIDHVVVVNSFSMDEVRERRLAGLDDRAGPASARVPDTASPMAFELIRFNRWLVDAVSSIPEITPFVAVDPWLLAPAECAEHLADMRERGARGVKIHPVEQRFHVGDPRMLPVYQTCVDLDLTVLAHSGPSRSGTQVADPHAFVDVLRSVPRLRLVVAHLGGASWQQIPKLAQSCPQALFDLSEIVAWVGAPNAPTADELVRLVRGVGIDRVLFGSDFPWYDPGAMARGVRELPDLSEGECEAILGGNAARALSLPV